MYCRAVLRWFSNCIEPRYKSSALPLTDEVYTQTLSGTAFRERVQFDEFLQEFSELEQDGFQSTIKQSMTDGGWRFGGVVIEGVVEESYRWQEQKMWSIYQ